jgi:hypothetical protein
VRRHRHPAATRSKQDRAYRLSRLSRPHVSPLRNRTPPARLRFRRTGEAGAPPAPELAAAGPGRPLGTRGGHRRAEERPAQRPAARRRHHAWRRKRGQVSGPHRAHSVPRRWCSWAPCGCPQTQTASSAFIVSPTVRRPESYGPDRRIPAADTLYMPGADPQLLRTALPSGTDYLTVRDVDVREPAAHGFFRHLFFARFGHRTAHPRAMRRNSQPKPTRIDHPLLPVMMERQLPGVNFSHRYRSERSLSAIGRPGGSSPLRQLTLRNVRLDW